MSIRFLVLVSVVLLFTQFQSRANEVFSFFVAGHAYGAHAGKNIGLHPPFLQKAGSEFDSTVFAIFLTGDLVNQSTQASWDQVAMELDSFGISSYYSMGNHDENPIGYQAFNEKYGSTYYSLTYGSNLFVVLNSTIGDRQISEEQLLFLKNCLENSDAQIKNVFVFFHEVLWNSIEKYKDVLSNSRSRYNQMQARSNYWTEVHPILVSFTKPVYIFTGDVGGNTDAIAMFYDRCDNVTLVSSGMGEVADENFIRVNVEGESVEILPISLRDTVVLKPIEFYSVPEKPDTIYGPTLVNAGTTQVEYSIPEIFNSIETKWTLSDGINGNSAINSILVDFSNSFQRGEISVQAVHPGFGTSEMKTMNVVANPTFIELNELQESQLSWICRDDILSIKTSGFPQETIQLKIVDITGNCRLMREINIDSDQLEIKVEINSLQSGAYIIKLDGFSLHKTQKIFLK